jgi:hypothetical protein
MDLVRRVVRPFRALVILEIPLVLLVNGLHVLQGKCDVQMVSVQLHHKRRLYARLPGIVISQNLFVVLMAIVVVIQLTVMLTSLQAERRIEFYQVVQSYVLLFVLFSAKTALALLSPLTARHSKIRPICAVTTLTLADRAHVLQTCFVLQEVQHYVLMDPVEDLLESVVPLSKRLHALLQCTNALTATVQVPV